MIQTSKTDRRPRRRLRRVLTAGVACMMLTGFSLTAVYSVGLSGKPEPADGITPADGSLLRYVQASQRKPSEAAAPVAVELPDCSETVLLSQADGQAQAQAQLADAKAYLRRAISVEIYVDGTQYKAVLVDGTVADALTKAGVALGEDDLVFPAMDIVLHRGTPVTVTRVQVKTRTQETPLPFATKIVENSELPAGESRVVSAGENGVKQTVYKDRYADGVLIDTVVAGESVTKPAVDAVLEIGTGRTGLLSSYYNTDAVISELTLPEGVTLDANGIPTQYQAVIEGDATAYTGDPATSTGRTPMPGHIAVDPNEIPYGTEMYIVSADGSYVYGYAIAADTGGFIYTTDRLVDLYMDNEQMCDDWGVRPVRIYVL